MRTIGVCVALALAVTQVALAEAPVVRFSASDQAAARAAVVTPADLGSTWKGAIEKNAKPLEAENCPGLWEPRQSDLVITGVAKSNFSGNGAQIESAVQVYKTARMAELDWSRSVSAAGLACMRQHAAADKTPGVRFISIARSPFPRVGEQTIRFRMIAEVTSAAGAAPLRMLIDVVLLGRGRTGISFSLMVPYQLRAGADAFEVRLARALNSRIRV